MPKSLTTLLLLAISMQIHADPLLLDDLKSQNGVRLTVDELKVLMPGAKVLSRAGATGSTRFWTNELDGKFVASSDNRSGSGGHGGNTTAQGTWLTTELIVSLWSGEVTLKTGAVTSSNWGTNTTASD